MNIMKINIIIIRCQRGVQKVRGLYRGGERRPRAVSGGADWYDHHDDDHGDQGNDHEAHDDHNDEMMEMQAVYL